MRRGSRIKNRIDYQILHSTGNKVSKKSSTESSVEEISILLEELDINKMDDLLIQIGCISDDIEDFLDEHPINNMVDSIEDTDATLEKLCSLRSLYRMKHKELLKSEDYPASTQAEVYNTQMVAIKGYIQEANDKRHKVRLKYYAVSQEKKVAEEKQSRFLTVEVKRMMSELERMVKDDVTDYSNNEILQRKTSMNEVSTKMHNLSKKLSLLHTMNTDVTEVDLLTRWYEKLSDLHGNYEKTLVHEISSREIEKEKLFQESSLCIKLGRFKGYNSEVDVYTFHDDFDKLYQRTTPKRLQPDLLKNNHLEEPALSMVKSIDNIDEIWDRLTSAYGDAKVMLTNKISQLNTIQSLWKYKEPERVIEALTKVINLMKELMKMSKKHNIEAKLYHGDSIERIYKLLGDSRVTRWLSGTYDQKLDDKQAWSKLTEFLEKDMKIQQQKLMFCGGKFQEEKKTDFKPQDTRKKFVHQFKDASNNNESIYNAEGMNDCLLCGESGHVATQGPGGVKLIQYFTCKKFVEMSPLQRFLLLRSKGYCFQCLLPGALSSDKKHKEGRCQRDFACPHPSHIKYPSRKHVLVCEEHKDDEANKEVLAQYKDRCIFKQKSVQLPSFSKEIKLSFHSSGNTYNISTDEENDDSIVTDRGVYQLQTIKIAEQCYNLFFDSGCGDFVCRHKAIKQLGSRASLEYDGVINMGGVGGITTQSAHGIYTARLPLSNGKNATMTGACLDQITTSFPMYPIQGKVENDIKSAYQRRGGNINDLPKLPALVGGEVDFMVGIKYLRYHPEIIFQLPSGLTIYKSVFKSADGGDGIIGGPHEIFTQIDQCLMTSNKTNYLLQQLSMYKSGYQINPDVSLLGYKTSKFNDENDGGDILEVKESYPSRKLRLFNEVEKAGTDVMYRCIKCRGCNDCKNYEQQEAVSIKEEIEQDLINKSINIDVSSRSSIAVLPFLHDPKMKLSPNKHKALKVYYQQLKKLRNSQNDKDAIIKAENKLHELGYVDFVRNLPPDIQNMLQKNVVHNFIPWRAVWKETSVSTPCRIVFDASQITDSGFSLNDILAKGRNNMNKLQEIVIRWSMHAAAFHTDVRKMYNSVKLKPDNWCYQRYIWSADLDPNKIPEEKVIKTLIYGVRSSGNQAERAIRQTAKLSSDEYPKVADIVCKDVYVDDCLSGESSITLAKMRADEFEIVLNRGGFGLKGISFSGEDPPESMSDDGISVTIAGMKWYPKKDELSLNFDELIFAKKSRGRKIINENSKNVPELLTRRHCVSKIAEIFDLTGKIMPLVSSFKMDLHELVARKLDWDDVIPNDLRSKWLSNFKVMEDIGKITFKRAIIPSDAENLDIDTIDFGDASQVMACAAVYARFKRRNGTYSCQLVFSRSKLISEGTTQPRAELIAALLNTHTGEVVRRSFGSYHKDHIKLSDSEIVLHWLRNQDKPLKQWVRNRVLEIHRFTQIKNWFHVDSKKMIADIGTRPGATINDVTQNSLWINGFDWMKMEKHHMPIKSITDINLTGQSTSEFQKEMYDVSLQNSYLQSSQVMLDEIQRRHEFSLYIINPNKFRFQTVVRIVAFIIKFVKCLRKKTKSNRLVKSKALTLSDAEINDAKMYFYRRASLEVIQFNKKSSYENISKEKDGILWYTGRILPSDHVSAVGKMTKSMIDLSASTFCVPILDSHSPLAYSIIEDIHWHDKTVKHSGVESVWRSVLKVAYILDGKRIVKKVRKSCHRCRYLMKKSIEVAMGPISEYNLKIAPAFYICQVDLAGPFMAYSPHNKRTTVKVWMAVFVCCTTCTTSIKIMEDYSTGAFVQAFIRLSCDVGYPKVLLPDEGSQLIKACENMVFSFKDLKSHLHQHAKVEFEPCPVGGHYMHGRVERKIREIKSSVEKSYQNARLSLIQWETVCSEVSNSINNLPLALGSITSNFESMDLITPNRLKLGRNNDRSPEGPLILTNDPDKFMQSNKHIFDAWFENWLVSHVPKLMESPKWFKTTYDLKEGDIVLFMKQDSVLNSKYQYGMVKSVNAGKDGLIRKALIKYRNSNENTDRETFRSVRELIVIHSLDELNIVYELGKVATAADIRFRKEQNCLVMTQSNFLSHAGGM